MNVEARDEALCLARKAEEALLDCAVVGGLILSEEDIVESDKDAPQDPRPELARLMDAAFTASLELRVFLEGL